MVLSLRGRVDLATFSQSFVSSRLSFLLFMILHPETYEVGLTKQLNDYSNYLWQQGANSGQMMINHERTSMCLADVLPV